jgi:hypothetical protein
MYKLKSDLQNLRRDVQNFKNSSRVVQIRSPSFDEQEQELIRRVITSVISQMKDKNDVNVANSILDKTRWLIE